MQPCLTLFKAFESGSSVFLLFLSYNGGRWGEMFISISHVDPDLRHTVLSSDTVNRK